MSYRIQLSESIDLNLRRIVAERLEKAIDAIDADGTEAAHTVRKQLKKARAALRLVRDAEPKLYEQENDALRDAARHMSDVRDSEAMVETFDALTEHYNDHIDRRHYTPIGQTLRDLLETARQESAERDDPAAVRELLEAAHDRIDDWPTLPDSFKPLGQGLARSYERGRDQLKAFASQSAPADPETVHTLRKRAKYHRYHTRLLQDAWTPVLKTHRKQLHDLTDQLGMHRDLHVLSETLDADPGAFAQRERVEELVLMARTRQEDLSDEAQRLGHKLFAEKPKHLVKRWKQYWKAQREHHQPERTLELANVA